MTQKRNPGGVIIALVLTAAGIVLLFRQLGIVPGWIVITFWPVVLILVGIGQTFSTGHRGPRAWGIVLILAGVIVELNQLGITHIGFDLAWPLLLIGAGVSLLWHVLLGPQRPLPGPAERQFDLLAVFGGGERRIAVQNFLGGRLLCFCGGYKIDLRSADMSDSPAVIEIQAIFGGAEIIVPEDWHVSMEGKEIFGGSSDETRYLRRDPSAPDKTLVIRGLSLFGGFSVKN